MNRSSNEQIQGSSPIDNVLSRLRSVEKVSSGYTALCPSHDDSTPSLSVKKGEDGRVLLHCHAGCGLDDILQRLGLEWRDLFSRNQDRSWKPWEGKEVAAYVYHEPDGQPLFRVVRYEMRDPDHPAYGEKQFAQQAYLPEHPDAGKKGCPKGFVWGRAKHGIDHILYNKPEVIQAIQQGETVYVVEGEKDAETLRRLGLTATCNPGGASRGKDPGKKWTPAMTETLAGADVVCLPDNDTSGRDFMDVVGQKLVRAGSTVCIFDLPGLGPKGDVTDWIGTGGTVEELAEVVSATRPEPYVCTTAEELLEKCREIGQVDTIFSSVDALASLPQGEYATIKRDLKAATGVNLNDLEAAVQEARAELEKARTDEAIEGRRKELEKAPESVVVVRRRPSTEIVDDLCAALAEPGDSTDLYRRDGTLVRITKSAEGYHRIEGVSDAFFDDCVARGSLCVDEEYQPCDPKMRYVKRVMECLACPELRGITHAPVLRSSGTVLRTPGYDEETRLLYIPLEGAAPPDVPLDPSRAQLEDALSLVREATIDHPFADAASEANQLALALTPVVRPMLGDVNIPLAVVDAPRAGSGKSLLVTIIGIMATGTVPATMSAPTNDAEWRKQITAQLRAGAEFVVVDDVTGTLDSASLRRAITSSKWSDRVLGESETVVLPASTIWCATGNNLRPRGDMVRRCYLIRLNTKMQKPHLREGFTHEQPAWTLEHRSELAAALLTLARAWVAAGQPAPTSCPTLGSFESWCHIIGGILEHVGVDGFLGNLDEFESSVFAEDNQWSLLLQHIWTWQHEGRQSETRNSDTFTVNELVEAIEAYSGHEIDPGLHVTNIIRYLPETIQAKLRRDEPFAHSLGRMFGYRQDRPYPGGWYIEQVASGREGHEWAVHREVEPTETNHTDTQADDSTGEAGGDVTIDSATKDGSDTPLPLRAEGVGGTPASQKRGNLSSHRHEDDHPHGYASDEAPF